MTVITDPAVIAEVRSTPARGPGRPLSQDTESLLAGKVLLYPARVPNHRWYRTARQHGMRFRTKRTDRGVFAWMEVTP